MSRFTPLLSSLVRARCGLLVQATQPLVHTSLYCLRVSYLTESAALHYIPCRWKSKGKGRPQVSHVSKDQLPNDLLELIRIEDMSAQFEAALNKFQSSLQQKLALKITPQMLADLTIPEAHTKLGQIANLVSQHDHQSLKQSTGGASLGASQQVLIDFTTRPDLIGAARKAISQYLESANRGSASSLIQSAGQNAFTVQLRTIVTKEIREELIHKGNEMLNQVKREMDRIYQTHDKLIPATPERKKHFSEDHLFMAREYLRAMVKQNHTLATSIWEKKQAELRGS